MSNVSLFTIITRVLKACLYLTFCFLKAIDSYNLYIMSMSYTGLRVKNQEIWDKSSAKLSTPKKNL